MTIDLYTLDLRNKKAKAEGIVEVVDDRVTIAVAKEGGPRPKSFEEAEGVTVYYFKKSPPPPRPEFRIVALTAGKEADAEKELNRLAREGFELVSTTQPIATDPRATVTTIHFVLRRTVSE
jgi:hypothetical protein